MNNNDACVMVKADDLAIAVEHLSYRIADAAKYKNHIEGAISVSTVDAHNRLATILANHHQMVVARRVIVRDAELFESLAKK